MISHTLHPCFLFVCFQWTLSHPDLPSFNVCLVISSFVLMSTGKCNIKLWNFYMRLPECLHKRFLSIFVSRKLSGICYYQNHDGGKRLWPCNFERKCTFSVSPRRRQRRNMLRFETRLLKNALPHRETNDSLGNGKFCRLLFCLVRCEGIWTLWLIQPRSRSVCGVRVKDIVMIGRYFADAWAVFTTWSLWCTNVWLASLQSSGSAQSCVVRSKLSNGGFVSKLNKNWLHRWMQSL